MRARLRPATTAAAAALALTLTAQPALAVPSPSPNGPWPAPGANVKDPTKQKPVAITGTATSLQPDSSRKPLVIVENNQEKGGKSLTIPADVLFDKDSATLSANASANLDNVVSKLQGANVTGPVQIIGHTDDTGTKAHNLQLSKQRAKAVNDAMRPKLASSGITLKWSGVGEKDPLAKNTSEANRKRNRRVAFVYHTSDTTPDPADDYDISVPVTQSVTKPADALPNAIGSAERHIRIDSTTYQIRVDVLSLTRQNGLICARLATTLVAQAGTDVFDDIGAIYSGTTDVTNEDAINAYLFDPTNKQMLGPLITGKGEPVYNLGQSDQLKPPDSSEYGEIYFPAPTTKATTLSMYVPALGTMDNLKIS